VCAAALAAACGGAPAAPPEAPPSAPTAAPPAAPLKAAAEETREVDLRPVPAPGEVVFRMQARSVGQTLRTLAAFGKIPDTLVSAGVRQVLKEIAEDAVESPDRAAAFAETMDPEAPIDFVLVVDTQSRKSMPEPMPAVAVGLTSAQAAVRATGARPAGDGLWRIDGGDGEREDDGCVIALAAGKAPARLVCAEDARQLGKLAPYLARTVPSEPLAAADLHMELALRGLLDKYGRGWANQARGLPVFAEELKMGNATFDRALLDAAQALADEAGALIADADGAVLDLSVDPQKGGRVLGELRLVGKRSWLARALLDGAHLAGPAPELFWRVPASATTVSYARAGDPALYEGILATGRILVEGMLDKAQFATPADRKAIAKLLRSPFAAKHTAGVSVSGHFAAPGAASGPKPGHPLLEMFGDTVGWHMFGVEEPPATIVAYAKELVATYNRPTLQAALKKELGSEANLLPTVKTVAAPRALGAGALDVEIAMTVPDGAIPPSAVPGGAPPKAKPVTLRVHLLVMGDGGRTWFGVAANRDGLAELMAQAKGAQPGPKSLASRNDLGRFKSEKHGSGFFVSLRGMFDSMKPSMEAAFTNKGGANDLAQLLQLFERMPHKGATPIVGFADAVDGARPSVKLVVELPREILVDAGFLVQEIIKLAGAKP
jgi:hypothetical protein